MKRKRERKRIERERDRGKREKERKREEQCEGVESGRGEQRGRASERVSGVKKRQR